MDKIEKHIHEILYKHRVYKRREFFDVLLNEIDNIFDLLLIFPEVEEYVEDDEEEFEFKQSNFNINTSLYDIGCLEGEIVDMYEERLEVVNSKESLVLYDNKPYSLSTAATLIAIKNGGSGKRSGWYVGRWNGKPLVEYKKEHNVKVITE